MKISRSKIISIFLAALIVLELSACKSKSAPNKNKNTKQSITCNLINEPESLDPAFNYSLEGSNVTQNIFEGLTRLNDKDKIEKAVAEKWNVTENNTNYTFFLRKNAKWSDGKPVTAYDFEYEWKRMLNSSVGSRYAYKLYCLKNAEDYNKGKASEDKVGVKAIDKYTLNVLLQNPNSKFLKAAAAQVFFPLRKDLVENKNDKNISNGSFVISSWQKTKNMILVKNKNYWDKKDVKLEKLKFTFEKNSNNYYKLYKDGKIDVIEYPPKGDVEKLIKSGEAKEYQYEGISYLNINLAQISDLRLRRAISLAINRSIIANKVSSGDGKAAVSLIPLDIRDNNNNTFSKAYYSGDGDIEKAKSLLQEYLQSGSVPELSIMYVQKEDNINIVNTIKDMLKSNLNIDVKLLEYDAEKFDEKIVKKDYSMALENVTGDYSDPIIFLDAFVTGGGENTGGYSNSKYDSLVMEAKNVDNEDSRNDKMRSAENVLIEDMPIIPLYELNITISKKDYIKDLSINKFGIIDFRKAKIENK